MLLLFSLLFVVLRRMFAYIGRTTPFDFSVCYRPFNHHSKYVKKGFMSVTMTAVTVTIVHRLHEYDKLMLRPVIEGCLNRTQWSIKRKRKRFLFRISMRIELLKNKIAFWSPHRDFFFQEFRELPQLCSVQPKYQLTIGLEILQPRLLSYVFYRFLCFFSE